MKRLFRYLLCVSLALYGAGLQAQILPKPASQQQAEGQFTVGKTLGVKTNVKGVEKTRLIAAIENGLQTQVTNGAELLLNLDKKFGKPSLTADKAGAGDAVYEGYELVVTPKKVSITARTGQGLFYGLQSLFQLQQNGTVPATKIVDEPRFRYRGLMLDCSRHFFGKDFIIRQIHEMAKYKLNRLHLHLTDAAAWRLEMDQYPELTKQTAFRMENDWTKWWVNRDRRYVPEGTPGAFGGYLTKNDVREILAVAADHYITILPEIEMPGHSEEVMTVYPELACGWAPVNEGTVQGPMVPNRHSDFCVGNEKTFEFIENVLKEVVDLFPSEYIHIGGDEAGKWAWKTCPHCQAKAKELGIVARPDASVEDQLQSYFIQRVEKIVEKLGRKMIGWDEILEGGLAENATVMSWRGEAGGIKTVKSGHHAVMTPGSYLYIDSYQDAPQYQLEAIGGYLPLERVYSYNPIPDSLTVAEASLIDGVQANLWTEYVKTPEHCEAMIWPRLLAVAEVGWTPQELRGSYPEFKERALTEVAKLEANGLHPFKLKYEFGNRREYYEPVKHLALGKKVTYHVPYSSSYVAAGESTLTDGLCGGWSYGDGRWQGFINKGRVDVTIDLEQPTDVHEVYAMFMQMPGPDIYHPAFIQIETSLDGVNYQELYQLDYPASKEEPYNFKYFGWKGDKSVKARYIRYKANCGKIGGFQFTDEIIVK